MFTLRVQRFSGETMIARGFTLDGRGALGVVFGIFVIGGLIGFMVAGLGQRHNAGLVEPPSNTIEVHKLKEEAEQLALRAKTLEVANANEIAGIRASLWEANAKINSVTELLGVQESADLALEDSPGRSIDYASESAFAALTNQTRVILKKASLIQRKTLAKIEAEQMKIGGKPVDSGWLSSRYGWRNDPFTSSRTWHNGIDYAARKGTIVRSLGPGIVIKAELDGGFGNVVEVEHPGGIISRYAHNYQLKVEPGDIVAGHQPIATVGTSGRSTGYHLHLELIDGDQSLNPEDFVGVERDVLLSAGPTPNTKDG